MAFEAVKDLWDNGYNFGDVVGSLWQGSFGTGGLTDLIFGWSPLQEDGSWDFLGSGDEEQESTENWSDAMDQISTSIQPYSDEIKVLGQQAKSSSDALSMLKELSKTDEKYRGLYLTLLSEIENNDRAWNRYVEYNKNYIPMLVDSYKRAGLNPWLALQSMGQPGTASVSSAGSGGSLASAINASVNQDKLDISKITGLATLLLVAMKFL